MCGARRERSHFAFALDWLLSSVLFNLFYFSRGPIGGETRRSNKKRPNSFYSRSDLRSKRFMSGLWKAPFVAQQELWDCGLACCMMILESLGRNVDRKALLKFLQTSSIWTIDLSLLLHEYGVRLVFLTRNPGVKTDYRSVEFYKKEFEKDIGRVERRFRESEARGIGVQQASLSATDLSELVALECCAVLMLVNSSHLAHHQTSGGSAASTSTGDQPYRGHYLLVLGYKRNEDTFVVRDPAMCGEVLHLASAALDEARLSFGTDEDVLIIDLYASKSSSGNRAPFTPELASVLHRLGINNIPGNEPKPTDIETQSSSRWKWFDALLRTLDAKTKPAEETQYCHQVLAGSEG